MDLPIPPEPKLSGGRLRIMDIDGRAQESILKPFEGVASDGNRYFIKSRRTDLNPLLCEWVCSRLAQALGLRCPNVCIAYLPAILVSACPFADYDLVPGWVFASEAVPYADTFPKSATKEVPAEERQRLLAFDHWIHNTDRRDANPNLLWQAHHRTLWLIDHHLTLSASPVRDARETHIFRDDWQACWDGANGDRHRSWLQKGLAHLPAILEAIPQEWLKDAGDFPEKVSKLLSRQLP